MPQLSGLGDAVTGLSATIVGGRGATYVVVVLVVVVVVTGGGAQPATANATSAAIQ